MTTVIKPSERDHRFLSKDEDFELFFDYDEYCLEFMAIQIVGYLETPSGGVKTHIYDNETGGSTITNPDEANPLVWGNVRWDGCCNLGFQDGLVHFCGLGDASTVGEVIESVYALAKKHLTAWYDEL